MRGVADLIAGFRSGGLTRRDVLFRGLALGLSAPALMATLAACGGDDETTSTATAAPPTTPEGTPSPDSAVTAPPGDGGTPTSPGNEEPTSTSTDDRNESDNRDFVMLFNGGVPDLDPHSAYDSQASSMLVAAYEMLIQLKGDSTFEYEPMLASAWETNDDLSEYTFTIEPGITFHDGTACDAGAVVSSLTRLIAMEMGPVDVVRRFIPDPASQMTAVDPTTVRFTMTKPEPLFLAAMSSIYGPMIISPAAIQEHATPEDEFAHGWAEMNVVGTGPYRLVEAEPQDRFVFERFDGYHGTPPFFETIVARVVEESATRRQLVEAGEAHGVALLPVIDVVQMDEQGSAEVVYYDTMQCNWVLLNYARLSRDARAGLCYAFPYDDVIQSVYLGLAKRQGPVADNVIGYNPDIPMYALDLAKAQELLSLGGVNEGDSLDFVLQSGITEDLELAQLFQASLAEIEVTVNIIELDRSAFLDLAYGELPAEERPHMLLAGWWPDYNDSYSQLHPNFSSESAGTGGNALFYSNPEATELINQLGQAASAEDFENLTGQIVQILMWDDPAAVFTGQIQRATVLTPDIRGFTANPIYLGGYNFREMWREAVS